MKKKIKSPYSFLVGVAILLVSIAAHPAASEKSIKAIQPIISLLLLDSEEASMPSLASAVYSKSGVQRVGNEIIVSFFDPVVNAEVGELSCSLVEQPEGSNLTVSLVDEVLFVFTPEVAGTYVLTCADNSGNQKDVRISVSDPPGYNPSKLDNSRPDLSPEELIALVRNQSWINSYSLGEGELRDIVGEYSEFTILEYDSSFGLLVEYDDEDTLTKEILEKISLVSGVDSVRLRVVEGAFPAYELNAIPNDAGQLDDLGDNWHLEKIKIANAWSIETGNESVKIGVSDGFFYSGHEDLLFSSYAAYDPSWSEEEYDALINHGNKSVGVIGAVTNNALGIAGINQNANLFSTNMGIGHVKTLVADIPDIKLLNMSWSWVNEIKDVFSTATFNPNLALHRRLILEELSTKYSPRIRDYVTGDQGAEKLFVFSAGNGVGNGAPVDPNITGFGFDAKLNGGNIHYENGALRRLSNVLVVGAILPDGRMPKLSNYGESVDIVAPTNYLSTSKYDYAYYGGTSASAPVVTGVASLLFSILPDADGNVIKEILLRGATERVTERYSLGEAGVDGESVPVDLEHPIPILNAENAVNLAQTIKDGERVNAKIKIIDPSQNTIQVVVTTASKQLKLQGFTLAIRRKAELGYEEFTTPISMNIDSSNLATFTLPLSEGFSDYQISGFGNILHEPTQINRNSLLEAIEFRVLKVGMSARSATESAINVSGAQLNIEPWGNPISSAAYSVATNENGDAMLYLMPGNYKIHSSAAGYQSTTTTLTILDKPQVSTIAKTVLLPEISAPMVGSISGLVTDEEGQPVSNALVYVVGGGVTTSAVSDDSGYYQIKDIPKEVDGVYVSDFTVTATARGYADTEVQNVIVLSLGDGEVAQNLILTEQELYYRDSDTNTVHDLSTNLIWLDNPGRTNAAKFNVASDYCANYSVSGLSNWRLPSIGELEGLVDTRYSPTTNHPFLNLQPKIYFSTSRSATYRRCPTIDGHANWVLNFANGQRSSSVIYNWTAFCNSGGYSNSQNYICVHDR